MAIITLTSDFGKRSHYTAVLQGLIYRLFPDAKIVEISHEIPNFDIMEAAFIVKNTYKHFPEGTVHLIALDPDCTTDNKTGIIMECDGHYFVAPDNGMCSLIAEHRTYTCWAISAEVLHEKFPKSFRIGQYLAPVTAMLAKGSRPENLGSPFTMKELIWGAPIQNADTIRGHILHIDKFGNAITNIHKELFLDVKKERGFQIFLRNFRLKKIVATYSDVGKGDHLAIFGTSGYLEVAMREASAADLLGLKVHDMITIEFR